MKANSLEELVTNSNIVGELRNHTDWHTRFMKFAQLVAEWQKSQMLKDAINGWLDEDNESPYDLNVICEKKIPFGKFKHGDKVRIIIVKED